MQGKPVLVGKGTDGAAVNLGEQTGLKGQEQRDLPWLFWSWCYVHHLELACMDAFSSSLFGSIEFQFISNKLSNVFGKKFDVL